MCPLFALAILPRQILGTFCVHLCPEPIAVWSRLCRKTRCVPRARLDQPSAYEQQFEKVELCSSTSMSSLDKQAVFQRSALLDQLLSASSLECVTWHSRAPVISVTAAMWHCTQRILDELLLFQDKNNPMQGQILRAKPPRCLRPL